MDPRQKFAKVVVVKDKLVNIVATRQGIRA